MFFSPNKYFFMDNKGYVDSLKLWAMKSITYSSKSIFSIFVSLISVPKNDLVII